MEAVHHWSRYGFLSLLITPLMVFELLVITASGSFSFSTLGIAALYPLSLLILALSPLFFRPGSYESPQAYVQFTKGARYSVVATLIVAVLVALLLGIIYHEFLVGMGIVVVTFGSLILPEASAAGAYGYLLAKDENVDDFFHKAGRYPLSREMLVIFWLALFLRNKSILKRLPVSADFVTLLSGAYFLGWGLLSLAGGFPASLFGASLGALIPLSSFISLRKRTTTEERNKLSESLSSRAHKTFHISASPPAGDPKGT